MQKKKGEREGWDGVVEGGTPLLSPPHQIIQRLITQRWPQWMSPWHRTVDIIIYNGKGDDD